MSERDPGARLRTRPASTAADALDWALTRDQEHLLTFSRELIKLRMDHPVFRRRLLVVDPNPHARQVQPLQDWKRFARHRQSPAMPMPAPYRR